jgi:hypothetical protein
MIAAQQKEKIRIVMDLSSPPDQSFNDNVDNKRLQKVHMATAKQVGHAIVACGPGAQMWKIDMVDAYKNLPAALPDLRLQGFSVIN